MGATLQILLVEDDDDDVLLLKRAFQKHFIGIVHVARDGEEAIDYLAGKGSFADRTKFPFPALVTSDLKMPRVTGFDLLTWISEHPEFHVIPTVILTSSADPNDMARAYKLGANNYLVKPSNFEQLCETAKLIRDYWDANIKQQPSEGI
jgi:CheY-like chemotaxis protein